MKHETIQRVATPTAILVALPEPLATLCTEALGEGGLRVLRAGHVAAASERIPVVMPQMVLVAPTLRSQELEALHDRCVAVGADVLHVGPEMPPQEVEDLIRSAAKIALTKALRGGRA